MIRNAFTMKLKPGNEAEYRRRHDEIWPELTAEISRAGIANYSIFLDESTLTLFAYQELTENNRSAELSSKEIMRRWWRAMSDLMESNADFSPVVHPLREVFHLD